MAMNELIILDQAATIKLSLLLQTFPSLFHVMMCYTSGFENYGINQL